MGPRYAHAEARKSPVVDGKVTRSADGKEVRFPVLLSPQVWSMHLARVPFPVVQDCLLHAFVYSQHCSECMCEHALLNDSACSRHIKLKLFTS